jgi:hypothetical protein
MKILSKLLLYLAYTWFVLFATVAFVGILLTATKQGIFEALWILSPFNVSNFIVTAICLTPGFLLLKLSEKVSH